MMTRLLGKAAGFLEEYESASHLVYICGFLYHSAGLHYWVHMLPGYGRAALASTAIAAVVTVGYKTRKSGRKEA